jgi:Tfp pilus assembly protein PilX
MNAIIGCRRSKATFGFPCHTLPVGEGVLCRFISAPVYARQCGGALIVSLIMLLVITLLVTSAIRSSNTNLLIVGNMQMQVQATAAAEQAINQILSSSANFNNTPAGLTVLVDINNDGTTDFSVSVSAPRCISMIPIGGTSATLSNLLATNDTYWDIVATVTDTRSGATVTLHQGVKIRLGLTFWQC